jgi:hypothetical protein
MTTTAKQLFDETLPQLILEHPEKAKIGGRYQVVVKGEGAWILDANGDPPTCKPGTEAADCTLTTDSASFQKIVGNPSIGTMMKLVMANKLDIKGNVKMVMDKGKQLVALFGSK